MRVVIAIGGNAIVHEGQRGTWDEQLESARGFAGRIVELRTEGHEVVLTHGNGPQVGALHLQQVEGEPDAPGLPLHALGAMTQGQLGYLLQTTLAEVDPDLPTAALLTRVVVADDDPAFERPTKPIGRFYEEDEARDLGAELGWQVAPDAGRGWRCIVASPRPLEILEAGVVERLATSGVLVIACGGGGVPMVRSRGAFAGVDAVIDKDRCSAELAVAVGADLLVMLTDVDRVALDFGTRWQRDMARLAVSDAKRLLADGEFPAGSIGPKIESAVRFVAGGGQAAVVTSAEQLLDAVAGRGGTWVVDDAEGPSRPVAADATLAGT